MFDPNSPAVTLTAMDSPETTSHNLPEREAPPQTLAQSLRRLFAPLGVVAVLIMKFLAPILILSVAVLSQPFRLGCGSSAS